MSSGGIPQDSNFLSTSCQLGGFTLNGIVSQGTAQSLNVVNIDDSAAAQTLTKSITGKFLQVNISGVNYFIPLYQ
jgi:hypothetical protein